MQIKGEASISNGKGNMELDVWVRLWCCLVAVWRVD